MERILEYCYTITVFTNHEIVGGLFVFVVFVFFAFLHFCFSILLENTMSMVRDVLCCRSGSMIAACFTLMAVHWTGYASCDHHHLRNATFVNSPRSHLEAHCSIVATLSRLLS